MKQYLLTSSGQDYKANLHCHTKLSDGGNTPEEVKEIYREKGYSIVAYTDHDVFIPHPELCDKDFLALNGFEIEVYDHEPTDEALVFSKDFKSMRTTHINMIALDEKIKLQPCFHRTRYFFGHAEKTKSLVKHDASQPDFERFYTPECINSIFKIGTDRGFFVTYNHPRWSLENFEVYGKYEGMTAIEVMNGGSIRAGYMDNDFQAYDDLLGQGKKVYAIAGDDNHCKSEAALCWTVIRAESLSYSAVAAALKAGNFYATNGPEFKNLYVENGCLCVQSSDVKNIIFTTGIRHTKNVFSKTGDAVNEGVFEIGEKDKYVRVTLVGFDGTTAYGNPYYLD